MITYKQRVVGRWIINLLALIAVNLGLYYVRVREVRYFETITVQIAI